VESDRAVKAILEKLRNEPVLATTLLGAVVVLLVQLGVPISDGLANAISAVVVAGLALFARSQVSPLRKDSQWN
jgi:hypothetical protein